MQERTLTVHRHGKNGYLIALRAEADETVRTEPFDAIELKVGLLLGNARTNQVPSGIPAGLSGSGKIFLASSSAPNAAASSERAK